MGAADMSVSHADLDLLDAYLLSDQSPPECMLVLRPRRGSNRDRDRPGGGDAERVAAPRLGRRGAGV